MPPAPKKAPGNKKLTTEEEAKQRADAVEDTDDEAYKKTLRVECRRLEDAIKSEERYSVLYNDERLRINYFWLIGKKELEDKQAELRNKERELQDLSEKHQIEIKIYKQKVKHLLFQNLDQLTELKKEAQITLKNVEDEHRIQERELKQDQRSLKVQHKEQQVRHSEYLNALTKEKNKESTRIRQEYERIANEIQYKYKYKMKLLRENMDKKRKQKIQQIEQKKNEAIKVLTQRHQKKYTDIKNYYNEIINTNMDIIKQLKEQLNDAKNEDEIKRREKNRQEEANNQVVGPLQKASEDVQNLKKKRDQHEKICNELVKCQEEIIEMERNSKEVEWGYEVRLQQFQFLDREKSELFENFTNMVYELHQKTGIRNLLLEKKLETIQESLETKDAQINQLLAAARIDPQSLGVIRSTLEEVENLKNDAIKEIQAELKKIREAHSNMVKTYEGKLSEFGIPVEELGFDPLVPANI